MSAPIDITDALWERIVMCERRIDALQSELGEVTRLLAQFKLTVESWSEK